MVKTENINFIASKYAPNPQEVSYWIDITADSTGNVIKSYSYDLKRWIPLNRDTNVDQWQHVKEIVDSVGLDYNVESDIISMPNISNNNYFKGNTVISAINAGDSSINSKFNSVDNNISALNSKVNAMEGSISDVDDLINTKGQPGGVASLDTNGKIPESQLPSYVDDVIEYGNLTAFPTIGESGKIYVALDTNLTYRWSGSAYVEISPSIALGETASTAYAGNKGAANAAAITALQTNKVSGTGVTDIQVVTALPEVPNATTLYIVIEPTETV